MSSDATAGTHEGSGVLTGPPVDVPEESLAEWFTDRVETHGDRVAVSCRNEHGEYEPTTFAELYDEARAVAGGLLDRGLEPGDRLAIRSETRYEWSVVDLASLLAGLVLVPVYPSFSGSQAAAVIDRVDADVLVTESADVEPEVASAVEGTIHVTELPRAPLDEVPGLDRDPEDAATIIPTSGTTGEPKGVEHTHRSLRGAIRLTDRVAPGFEAGDSGACFMPLSHIFQRVTNYAVWNRGGTAVFMDPDALVEDLRETEPELLSTVPRMYRRMYDELRAEVADMGEPKASLAEWAIGVAREYGRALEDGGRDPTAGLRARHAVADRLVLSTLREKLGLANVEISFTGAASLDPEALRFFWGLGVPLLEVYGATETGAPAAQNRIDSFRAGTVGTPLPGVEVTLADDGEVLVRGPAVMAGYWDDPEKTAAAFTEAPTDEWGPDGGTDATDPEGDGWWYRTGDVGEFDGEYLRIVDRKENLEVLDTGKNVYPAPIEVALRRQRHVAEAMVVAEDRKFVSALVQPDFDALLSFADEAGIDYDESAVEYEGSEATAVPPELVEHPRIRRLFDEAVAVANGDLAEHERVKEFRVLSRAFSVEAGELTPTSKKRRPAIRERFADEIEAIYRGSG